jgi:hypothetical protein
MKLAVSVFATLLISGCKTASQDGDSEIKDASNIVTMQKDPDGKFRILCDNGGQETRTIQEVIDNQVCMGSQPMVGLVYGDSDGCRTSKLIAMVDGTTDCNSMPNTNSWSIRVGDKCQDIVDAPAKNACVEIKAAITGQRAGLVYGDSDKCSTSKLIAMVDGTTDCSSMPNTNSWSIKVGDKCQDIYDASAKNACVEIKASITRQHAGLVYGDSDSCRTSKLIAMVDGTTDCNSMPNTNSWSIKVGDKCQDIDDAPAKNACLEVKSHL